MKKIIINKEQLAKINESLSNKKVVKITSKQYKLITESLNIQQTQHKIPNIVDFGSSIAKSINEIFGDNNDTFELPDTLVNLGIDPSDLKHRLLLDKIISVEENNEGLTDVKFLGKGFLKWCEKYLNDIVSPKTPNDLQIGSQEMEMAAESEMEEDYDGNHWNEDTPDAPWNEDGEDNEDKPLDFEYEPNDEVRLISKDTGTDVIVLNIHGEIVLFAHENLDAFKNMDIEQLVYNIINGHVLQHEMDNNYWSNDSFSKFANGDNNFVVVSPNRVVNALKAVDHAFGEVGKLPIIFEQIFIGDEEITEVTTTGSVGGSYETPMAWSKDPKNPKFRKKTAINGGTFVKPELIDDFDTIRENNEE